jgi:Ca-activated chloride channel family protein
MRKRLVFIVLLLLLLPAFLFSQSADNGNKGVRAKVKQEEIHPAPIRVDVNRVIVRVTVVDFYDRIVTGLKPENFQVFDDGVEQSVESFSNEDAPISVCIILDSTGSMGRKLEASKEAVRQFVQTSNPQDEFMLIAFSERPNVVVGFTSDRDAIEQSLLSLKSQGKTALLDAVYLGLTRMKEATRGRKFLLIISDGGDNYSRYTKRDVVESVKEADVQICTIGIFEPVWLRNRSNEEASGPFLLAELADISGGHMISIEPEQAQYNIEEELKDVAEKISTWMRNQYVIYYKPSNLVRDGRWRRIKVKLLNIPKSIAYPKAFARSGYYAPTN